MIFSAGIWQKVVHHYFLVWCWRLKLPVTSCMSPDYGIVTLLYKWDSRHGAIISSASWISWPQAGSWPTCYLPGSPRGHSKVLRSQVKGSRHLSFKASHMKLLVLKAGAASVSLPVPVSAMPVHPGGSVRPNKCSTGSKKKWCGAITALLSAYGLLRRFGSSRKKDKNSVLSV